MALTCKLGGLVVNINKIRFTGTDPYHDAPHKFVTPAQAQKGTVEIYAAEALEHLDIVDNFRLIGAIVGGGSLYINGEGRLVLGEYSKMFGAIPREIAKEFGNLLIPALQEQYELTFTGLLVNPSPEQLSSFWKGQGYKR
jgi:hypothetical protein